MQQAAVLGRARPAGGPQGVLPLAMAGTGGRVCIQQLGGGHETRRHLEHLGFVPGETIRVVSQAVGNLIVDVKGARVGLSSQMAAKIRVTPL